MIDRRGLAEKIQRLGTKDQERVFSILTHHTVPFSKNANGVFFNFKTISDLVAKEIATFIEMTEQRSTTCCLQENEFIQKMQTAITVANPSETASVPNSSLSATTTATETAIEANAREEAEQSLSWNLGSASKDTKLFIQHMNQFEQMAHSSTKKHGGQQNKFYQARRKVSKWADADTTEQYTYKSLEKDTYLL